MGGGEGEGTRIVRGPGHRSHGPGGSPVVDDDVARCLVGSADAQEAAGRARTAGRAASAAGFGHDRVASSSSGMVHRLHLCGSLNALNIFPSLELGEFRSKGRKSQLLAQTLVMGRERVLAGRVVGLQDDSCLVLGAAAGPGLGPGREGRREGPRGETQPSEGSRCDKVGAWGPRRLSLSL